MSIRSARPVLIATALVAVTSGLHAGADRPAVNIGRDNLALRGYDPVAYFTAARPTKGSPQFEYQWNGAVWRFANDDNRNAFAGEPTRYAPQFGGYCAWAVSRGYTADGDPGAWRIVAGRLYLNYSKRVQRQWEQDIPGNIKAAEANWPRVLDQ